MFYPLYLVANFLNKIYLLLVKNWLCSNVCRCFLLMVIYYHGLFHLSIYFFKKVLFFYKSYL